MGHRILLSVLLLGSLLPSVSFAQDGGLERHLSRGEGLYRMEKYGEAFMEFGKAGRYAAGADAAVRERLCRAPCHECGAGRRRRGAGAA